MAAIRPLDGVKVIEVANYIPAPIATRMMLDMGATVYKVERPGGDPMRHMEPRGPSGNNPIFDALNVGKQFVELDLKSGEGAAALRELAYTADVLIDGFRPGALARMELGPEQMRHLNPQLIYCALSGFGSTGPLSPVAGHDMNYVSLSGLLDMTLVDGRPAMPGTQLADLTGGMAALTAVLAALLERQHSGQGRFLDIALSDAAAWLMTPWLATLAAGQAIDVSTGVGNNLAGALAYYRLYATADGRYLAVAPLEPHFWRRFCETIERADLIPRQHDADQAGLAMIIAEVIATQPLEHWSRLFAEVDACVTPVLSLAEAAALPHFRDRGLIGDTPGVPPILKIQ